MNPELVQKALAESQLSGLDLLAALQKCAQDSNLAPLEQAQVLNELQLKQRNAAELDSGERPSVLVDSMAEYFSALETKAPENCLSVAMTNPLDFSARQLLSLISGYPVQADYISNQEFEQIFERTYRHKRAGIRVSTSINNYSQDNTVIRFVDDLIREAVYLGASDIHVEPFESQLLVRFRLDGALRVVRKMHKKTAAEIISRIKVMAGMDIGERRRPQDGKIRFEERTHKVDIRASVLPTEFGEKMVLRLLDKTAVDLNLSSLGMGQENLQIFQSQIQRPHGMILVTGPTGSGKTTTLYSALKEINDPERNICTVEDPVEYQMEGVIQTNVKPEIGLDFAQALRTLLRQDPNVIMVGEVRDLETAELAIRASLTGHLVFSTLHTNDAASTPIRLIDMGIEPFLVSSALSMIVSQRLVRKNCPDCLELYTPDVEVQQIFELDDTPMWKKGKGCSSCGNTGYQGRLAVYEFLPVDENFARIIHDGASLSQMREEMKRQSLHSLREDGRIKAELGLTTLEEVLRETV